MYDENGERLTPEDLAEIKAALRIQGPVDLARVEQAEWDEHYLTTASPIEFHASGYRLERLA